MKLLGKEAEVLERLFRGEEPPNSRPEREALKRLEDKGLVSASRLTEKGKAEIGERLGIIEKVGDVYDLKAAGGYRPELGFVYEPVTPFAYAWNWLGFRGVSALETQPRKGARFFKALKATFWLGEEPLRPEELTFTLPTPEAVEEWVKGVRLSLETKDLWNLSLAYFKFFLDLKEEAFYEAYTLFAFQTWLLHNFNSVWFLAATGAYGSGKTVGGEALVKLCRHGKVASPSVAWLGRSIERLQITPFVDEFDVLAEKDNELTRIARMCQRRGMTYDRVSEKGIPQSWRVFAPWIMSVHGELEEALATRTIPITTEETKDPKLPVLNTIKDSMAQSLYDEFWLWYMDSVDQLTAVDRVAPHIENPTNRGLQKTVNSVNSLLKEASSEEEKLKELQKRVFDELTVSVNREQLGQLESLSGRDVEIAYHMIQLSNLLGIDMTESIGRLMALKAEAEEERREVGVLGLLRDLLVKLYEKRREHPNYWTTKGEFMISNKEVYGELTPWLHEHQAPGVTPGQFKGFLRELGFDRPTGRRKMKIFTWAEIEEGAYGRFLEGKAERPARLALVFTEKALRRLGLRAEMPESLRQGKLPEAPKGQAGGAAARHCERCGGAATRTIVREDGPHYFCENCLKEWEGRL